MLCTYHVHINKYCIPISNVLRLLCIFGQTRNHESRLWFIICALPVKPTFTCLIEMDNDVELLHFYGSSPSATQDSNVNTNLFNLTDKLFSSLAKNIKVCDYHNIDSLLFNTDTNSLFIIHVNIRSFNKTLISFSNF